MKEKTRTQLNRELAELRQRVGELETDAVASGRRHQAVTRIVSVLNADLSVKEIVLEMSSILQDLIPCDRLSLGMLLLNRWCYLEEGRLTSSEFFFQHPLEEDHNATYWVICNQKPLLRRDISKERGSNAMQDALRRACIRI